MTKLSTLIFGLTVILTTVLFAAPSVVLDSGYFRDGHTNRAIGNFTLNAMDAMGELYSWGDKKLNAGTPGSVVFKAYMVFSAFTPYSVSSLFTLGYHEYGHGRMAQALGQTSSYRKVHSFENDDYGSEQSSYFGFILDLLSNPFRLEGAQALAEGPLYSHFSDSQLERYSALVSASGVNNETYLASLIDTQNFDRGVGSVFHLSMYQQAKLGVLYYVISEKQSTFGEGNGDLSRVQRFYRETYDYDLSLDALLVYSALAYGLSAATWDYYRGLSAYLTHNTPQFTPRTWGRWRRPELDFYLNGEGPSYKVRSAYRVSNTVSVPFSVEYVFQGNQILESEIGLNTYWTPSLLTRSLIRQGQAFSWENSIRSILSKYLSVELGWTHYNAHNLHDARHIPSLGNPTLTDDEVWLSMRYTF